MSGKDLKLSSIFILLVALSCFMIGALRPSSYPWLRISSSMYNMKISTNGEFIAFTDKAGFNLKVLETVSKNVYMVTPHMVMGSFFWSQDNCSLFYTEFSKNPLKNAKSQVQTNLKTYSCTKKSSDFIESYGDAKSFLSYSPKNKTLSIMGDGVVHQKKVVYEGEEPSDKEAISWIVTQRGVYRLSKDSQSLARISDDDSGILSYDVTSDGERIIWATKAGSIYVAGSGESRLLTSGIDPRWNQKGSMFIYVSKRDDLLDEYDLKISDLQGNERYLTATPGLKERFPVWYKRNKIAYTIENSTDIFLMEFINENSQDQDISMQTRYKDLPDSKVSSKGQTGSQDNNIDENNLDLDTEEPFLEEGLYENSDGGDDEGGKLQKY